MGPLRTVFGFLGGPGPCWGPENDKKAPKGHRERCVPGTSQASAEAENDEVAFFVGAFAVVVNLLEWGCEAHPRATNFLRGGGGVLGQFVLCPCVCLSVCLRRQTRKIRDFSKIAPSIRPFGGPAVPAQSFEVMLEKICWQIFPKKQFLSPADR